MKTYEEMAKNALTRGKAAREQRSKRNRIILSGVAVCGIAILLVFGLGGKDQGGPLNYGPVNYLAVTQITDAKINGQPFQYIAGKQPPNGGPQLEPPLPRFRIEEGYIHVVAKAEEELGVYATLNEYGSTKTDQYRMFRMKVIDPLQSEMVGEFYYLLPKTLQGDLTQYDALLISMRQLPKNYPLRQGSELTAFEYLFTTPKVETEICNIIAFTDGVFDESLWQDESWIYGYQFVDNILEQGDDLILVSRGSTLKEVLRRRKIQIKERGDWYNYTTVNHYNVQTEAAQQAMAYMMPFENGVFVPERYRSDYIARRYINGCPTSEWIRINLKKETVTASDYRFEDADFERLPDLSSYIASLDLKQIVPQHTDPSGKLLIYHSAVGWYEKTADGVYAIVRIAWRYFDEDDYYMGYYDETFILLDETGDRIISREDLIDLIGENPNIYHGEYGVAEPLPMA